MKFNLRRDAEDPKTRSVRIYGKQGGVSPRSRIPFLKYPQAPRQTLPQLEVYRLQYRYDH
jgi:hypothetical protein